MPNGTRSRRKVTKEPVHEVMTEQQRSFAAEQHNLVYSFLREKGWSVSEFYDVAALGFLRAVRRYLTEPALQKYPFSTIAWRAMGQSIVTFRRAEARRKVAEQQYLSMHPFSGQILGELDGRLLLHELAVISTDEQYRLVKLRLQGYSIAEAARAQGISPKRVHRLLQELFRTYLQLQSI